MYDRRLRPRRQYGAVMFCLIMIGIAVAITFAVARFYEASSLDVDSMSGAIRPEARDWARSG